MCLCMLKQMCLCTSSVAQRGALKKRTAWNGAWRFLTVRTKNLNSTHDVTKDRIEPKSKIEPRASYFGRNMLVNEKKHFDWMVGPGLASRAVTLFERI